MNEKRMKGEVINTEVMSVSLERRLLFIMGSLFFYLRQIIYALSICVRTMLFSL